MAGESKKNLCNRSHIILPSRFSPDYSSKKNKYFLSDLLGGIR